MPPVIHLASHPVAVGGPAGQDMALLSMLLNGLADPAIVALDEAGNVAGWSEGARRTTGYDAAEIVGRHFACFFTQADWSAGIPARALRLALELGRHEAELWQVRKDGGTFRARIVIQPLPGAGGTAGRFLVVTSDLDPAAERNTLREALNQSQTRAMAGKLTADVAHDFNGMLNALESGHDLILDYVQDARIAHFIEVNRATLQRSRKLISQILAFASRRPAAPKRCDIWDLITSMDALIQLAVGEQIRLRWNLHPDPPSVCVDPAKFQSTLLNLILNARDAMPDGGWLTVFMEKQPLAQPSFDPPFDVPAGDYMVFGVSDTGVGMTDEARQRAIEPLFTTKHAARGSGLGLSQCYAFARERGGTVKIDSLVGRGTTVRVLLPSMQAASATEAARPERTILFVDDDISTRTLVGEMLRILGYKVVEAEDAGDALNKLKANSAIDFLFTDVVMPNDMNGLELMAAARAVRPGLPTLLASMYPREVLRDFGTIPEDVSFIAKPYSLSDISAHVGAGRVLH